MRRERVPQRVRRRGFRDVRSSQRFPHRALERLVAHVMPPHKAAPWIDRAPVGGEHMLPAPFARRTRIFALERGGKPDGTEAVTQIDAVKVRDIVQVMAKRLDETSG